MSIYWKLRRINVDIDVETPWRETPLENDVQVLGFLHMYAVFFPEGKWQPKSTSSHVCVCVHCVCAVCVCVFNLGIFEHGAKLWMKKVPLFTEQRIWSDIAMKQT